MQKIQSQGVHHITLNGADRQTSIDFWEGVLGMPFIFEQPNLDAPHINHLYFDPGDGRLITIFTEEDRKPGNHVADQVGSVHHIAFNVSLASWTLATKRLAENGFKTSGPVDRGFMWSLYFREPCGLLVELACYKFDPPEGTSHAQVLRLAHDLRVLRGADNIEDVDLAEAIESLMTSRGLSLND